MTAREKRMLGEAERRRDPRAASFLPDAWPIYEHRTLAELEAERSFWGHDHGGEA